MASFRCIWLYAMELLPTTISPLMDAIRSYPVVLCSHEPSVRESPNEIIHSDADRNDIQMNDKFNDLMHLD
jgi:hypothetical protein